MKVLLLGDLHCRKEWFSWVLDQASAWDLIAVPGDLRDGFASDYPQQIEFLVDWVDQAKRLGVPLAWCSGNHDMARWTYLSPDQAARACWTDALRGPSIVGDLETKVFTKGEETILVSCLPYSESRSEQFESRIETLVQEAAGQRETLKCPWIILSHAPPNALPLSKGKDADFGDRRLRERIEKYHPDWIFSGHVHAAPFYGPFWAKIGPTTCLNPGFIAKASFPCHIVVDLTGGTAVFRYERDGQAHQEEMCRI